MEHFLCFNARAGNRTNGDGFKQKQREKKGGESMRVSEWKWEGDWECVRVRERERKSGRFF